VSDSVSVSYGYWVEGKQSREIKEIVDFQFKQVEAQFGLSVFDPVVWVKISISNHSQKKLQRYLHSNIPYLSRQIDLYSFSGELKQNEQHYLLEERVVGEQLIGSTLIYDVSLEPDEVKNIFIRNYALYAQVFDFSVHTQRSSSQALINKNLLPNILISILLALALYNLALYFFGEQRGFLFYCLYLLNASVGLFYMYGTVYHNFNIYGASTYWLNVTAILVPLFLSLFSRYALDTRKNSLLVDRMLSVVIIASLLDVFVAIVFGVTIALRLAPVVFLLSFIVLVVLVYQYLKQKHPLINLFVLAYVVYVLGMSITLFGLFGLLPFSDVSFYASGVGLVIEAILLSYLLRYRVILLERDVEDHKKTELHLSYLANHDPLTELPNRRLFFEIAEVLMNKTARNNEELAVLFIDLDGFKAINDNYGHKVGDELLKEVALRISRKLRKSDVVARVGGDEFVILLSGAVTPKSVATIAKSLVDLVSIPVQLSSGIVQVSSSIGISFYPADGLSVEALVVNADEAMYQVKQRGRNNWGVYVGS